MDCERRGVTRRYTVVEAGLDPATLPEGWESGDGKLASAFVRATKPTALAEKQGVTIQQLAPISMSATGGGCCGGSGCCGA